MKNRGPSEILPPLIYLLDKPAGLSTFDVIRRVRPRSSKHKRQKIGHFGTLDPFASGLVLVAVGAANRLAPLVHRYLKKSYWAKGVLGEKRDTGDVTGKVVEAGQYNWRDPIGIQAFGQKLREKVAALTEGTYWQIPPAYSAAKFQGKCLYHYARHGIDIRKPPVARKIDHLEILSYSLPSVEFRAQVSAGTYIRVLWEDMAQDWGGYLAELRRTAYGEIGVERAVPIPKESVAREVSIPALSPHQLLDFPAVWMEKKWRDQFICGNSVPLKRLKQGDDKALSGEPYRWAFDSAQTLLGLGTVEETRLAPKINFILAPRSC